MEQQRLFGLQEKVIDSLDMTKQPANTEIIQQSQAIVGGD